MSENPSKSAPLVSVLAILGLLALFLLVAVLLYVPRSTGTFVGDGIRTPEQRKKNLADLHAKDLQTATSYAWVDQKAGVVQLPLDRAVELTLQRYAQKP